MASIRASDNTEIEVTTPSGKTEKMKLFFGKGYLTEKLVLRKDSSEHYDVYFSNGNIGFGVHKDLFENYSTPVEESESREWKMEYDEVEIVDDDDDDVNEYDELDYPRDDEDIA